jgi:hypothetical protein
MITTGNAGNGTSPNSGVGGWNYGIFADTPSTLLGSPATTFTLGTAGNSAPAPGNTGP